MVAPTKPLRDLSDLAGRNPIAVLAATEHELPGTTDEQQLSWRQAARAEAYDTLSRPTEARRVAFGMMRRNVSVTDPLQVEHLVRFAMNGFHPDEIAQAFPIVERAQRRQAPGSAQDVCLQIALGEMQRMRGKPEMAVVYLARSYGATAEPSMMQQHILATEKLARVLDWAGDHLQAISLIEEVIAWDQARGRSVALSTDYYFRGSFNLARGTYRDALSDFDRSRALAPPEMDPVGSGFLDLQTCATLIELGAFARASALCQRASSIFGRYDEIAGSQAQLLLARIAFAQGKAEFALKLLDGLLAREDLLSSFASAPKAYKLRSDIERSLGRTGAAYRDLNIYVGAMERQRTMDQVRQGAVLRARFDADRSAARNHELQQRLQFSDERGREQAKRYTVLAFSATIGVILLLVILGMSVVHRRKLTRMADTDPLTGLLNRRFVDKHEAKLMADCAKAGPLLALAIIDLDHFKAINDAHGHSVGDEVLITFARRACEIMRADDVIARWGGEEFIAIFPHSSKAEAVDALERLQVALLAEIATTAGLVTVTFSAGVASFAGSHDLQSLIRGADRALYQAKASGRNRIETSREQTDLSEPYACGAPRRSEVASNHRQAAFVPSA